MKMPIIGEVRSFPAYAGYSKGETVRMIWNGKKWLRYDDVWMLINYARTQGRREANDGLR